MGRLIDANELIDAVYAFEHDHEKNTLDAYYVQNLINEQPTIDAVKAVRCKECKHNPKYTNDFMYGECPFTCEDSWYAATPDDDFYCGYGERKDNEQKR